VLAALAAPLLTGLWAVALAFRNRAATVPHGPSMCVAAAAVVVVAVAVVVPGMEVIGGARTHVRRPS
jgi:hypothetical protein